MERVHDDDKYVILYVDDEKKSLKYFTEAFGDKFRILSAANASEGYRLLEEHRDEIALLITDQRMPGEKGVKFLERARQLHPKAVRILTTAYSDFDVAIEAVNSAGIFKYVTKPWDIPELETTLERACEVFALQQENDQAVEDDFQSPTLEGRPESGELQTLEQVAQYLNVNKFTVYRLVIQKKIPAFKVGNQWRFKREMIDAWLMAKSNIKRTRRT